MSADLDTAHRERMAQIIAAEILKSRRAQLSKAFLLAIGGVGFLVSYGIVWRFYGWRLMVALFVLQIANNLERSNR